MTVVGPEWIIIKLSGGLFQLNLILC